MGSGRSPFRPIQPSPDLESSKSKEGMAFNEKMRTVNIPIQTLTHCSPHLPKPTPQRRRVRPFLPTHSLRAIKSLIRDYFFVSCLLLYFHFICPTPHPPNLQTYTLSISRSLSFLRFLYPMDALVEHKKRCLTLCLLAPLPPSSP